MQLQFMQLKNYDYLNVKVQLPGFFGIKFPQHKEFKTCLMAISFINNHNTRTHLMLSNIVKGYKQIPRPNESGFSSHRKFQLNHYVVLLGKNHLPTPSCPSPGNLTIIWADLNLNMMNVLFNFQVVSGKLGNLN